MAINFGDACKEDVQCTRNLVGSVCIGNCTCEYGFHQHGQQCFRNAVLDEACVDKRECIISPELENSVDCIQGVCACIGGKTNDELGCTVLSSASGLIMNFRNANIIGSLLVMTTMFVLLNS